MKFMEVKNVATVMMDGTEIETYAVKCYGNATYRVFIGNSAVTSIFPSEEAATRYAIECAVKNPHVLIGKAEIIRH